MRFVSLTYRRFGPFDDCTLDLSSGPGLHFIYGPNEAGKTTALRGLGHFLFGFPYKASDDFRHARSEQRIGAKLVDRQGREWQFLRSPRRKDPLREPDDTTVVAEETLRACLEGLRQEQFEMLFGLGHDRLVAGGRDISEGEGDVGKALFEAASGVAGLRRIEKRLLEDMGALYRPRGQNQAIAESQRKWKECRDSARSAALKVASWQEQAQALRSASDRKAELEGERRRNRTELDRLKSFRAAIPIVDALMALRTDLEPVKGATLLRSGFADEYRDTTQALLVSRNTSGVISGEVVRLQTALQTLEVPAAVLAEEQVIERLSRDLGAKLKAEIDRPGLHARMREHEGNARRVLRRSFGRDDLSEVDQLRLTDAAVARIRQLGGTKLGILARIDSSRDAMKELEQDVADKEQEIGELPEVPDVGELDSLSRAIAAEGPLEKNIREATTRLETAKKTVADDLKCLRPRWHQEPAKLLDQQVPGLVTIQRLQHHKDGLDEAQRDRANRQRECQESLAAYRDEIQSLSREGVVATEADLADLRKERDVGIDMIRLDCLGGAPDESVRLRFVERFAPGKHPIEAVQASVSECDQVVDTMRKESARAARLSHLRLDLDKTVRKGEQLSEQIAEIHRSQERFENDWQELWKQAGIRPLSPAEMRDWLQAYASIRERVEGQARDELDLQKQIDHLENCRNSLRKALGSASLRGDATLAELLETAQKRVRDAVNLGQRRERLAESLRELRRKVPRNEREQTKAQEDMTAWTAEWRDAIKVMQLSADTEPAVAYRYIDDIAEILREVREAGTLKLRLDGIERDRNHFLLALSSLRQRVLIEPCCDSVAETMQADVDELVRLLREAQSRQTKRRELEGQVKKKQEDIDEQQSKIRELDATLEVLRADAGVIQIEDIPAAIKESDERERLEALLLGERQKLAQQARGRPLDEFTRDADSARQDLEPRIQFLEERVEPLDTEIEKEAQAETSARKLLDEWRVADDRAATDAQEAECLLAMLRGQVEEYAVLHLARSALRLTIERFRLKNQDSMLNKAGHYFEMLTAGAFRGLETDEDESGTPTLKALRKNPSESLPVTALSDGTRDQLFLSLRLAAIEQHLTSYGPIPLAVDDVLVNCDNDRALATLQCLAELGRKTQILFFTHHRHLVDMATDLPEGTVFRHDLRPLALM
jgi:uncharacterized protein YhaN